ncbi:EAL domain-containing protein [Paraburkholderia hospita]|uniref:EAL domain-containing protein n=1 Tax=Paraburkholderia hospita TaxID=169430 RepID=UPI001404C4FA|nr:EAL domain-containing protein [Paraburkholderia hospita]
MSWFAKHPRDTGNDLRSGIDAFTFFFSYYLVPVAIAALSVLVLFLPAELPGRPVTTPLLLRVLGDPEARFDVGAAAEALRAQPLQNSFDTHRQETPVWFSAEIPPGNKAEHNGDDQSRLSAAVILPSKHIRQIECFDGSTLSLIGSISRNAVFSGDLLRAGSGVAIHPGHHTNVLCRAVFSGPALLAAYTGSVNDLKQINDSFHRRAGLLEGGLATLATFVFVAAIINRDWVYVLYAAWLFGNLRLGAISMGWDEQWLGSLLPLPWVPLIRKVTVPVYYILTYTLFVTLFRNDLARVGYKPLIRTIQFLGPLLLVASILLPVPTYLPVMWVVVSIGVADVIFLLGRLLTVAPSRTAVWYSLALATALLSSLSEVASAAFKTHIPALNSVTAALVSSLMAALAIAEQIRAERGERLRAQAELSRAYGATPIGLFTLSANGEFVQWNPALRSMLDIGNKVNSARWDDYFPAGLWKRIYNDAMDSGEVEIELSGSGKSTAKNVLQPPPRVDEPCTREDLTVSLQGSGNLRQYLLRAAYDGTRLECSLQDVTERHEATQTLQFLAEHDPLTGALNRRGLDKYIELRHCPSDGAPEPMVIAYLDLDRFKLINDLFGHHIGDAVLREVCQRIEARLDSRDRICRVGGDEFVILFVQTQLADAATVSQAVIDAIGNHPYEIDHRAFNVRASLGLVEAPVGVRPEEAISAADSACRQAKLDGNGRIIVYGNGAPMFEERARQMSLLKQFSGDRPPSGLYLEMQPIMSMTTPYDALDFEVLLRMRGADGVAIPPAKAIMAAETNGTISALDKWVMETTLTWISNNRSRLSRTRFVSVNVSAASLNDERFVNEVGVLFRRYRHVVPLLCIEITEGVALHDLANTRRLISSVQRLGAKVALDDFGAGYTSFPYLRDLPADALKIDGEFVKNISGSPANAAIAEAIIGLARNLGMQSIAEWVEDAPTLEILQAMGVDHVQGFAIGRPQAPEAILAATSAADFITDPLILAMIGPRTAAILSDDDSLQSLH